VNLKGRIPIEPLDDERLTQIERRIVAGAGERMDAPVRSWRRPLAWAGMAFAVGAALLVGWQLRGPGAPAAADKPQTFAMHTSPDRAVVELGDATIASEPGSAVDVTRGDGRVVVQMTKGRIEMAVVHREGRVVVVRAGETEIEDIGTKFAVTYDGANKVDVRVTEGEVRVTRQRKSERVAAGFAWTTERGVIAIADLVAAEQAAIVATAEPAVQPTAPTVAVAQPEPTPASAKPAVGKREPASPPSATREPTSAKPAASATRDEPAVARPRVAVASDPYLDLKVAIRSQPIVLDPKLDGANDAASEVARLKPIAYSSQKYGGEASLALYKMAVLLYKPLHQDGEALRTIDMYRRRFPSGAELAAVAWLRVRISCSRAIDDACRQAAYSYQREAPGGASADVAIRITNAQ
jgi:hypothetical protein